MKNRPQQIWRAFQFGEQGYATENACHLLYTNRVKLLTNKRQFFSDKKKGRKPTNTVLVKLAGLPAIERGEK
ncbi:MAG: hypothetical protein DMG34_12775 [Acidobacteria bacterium]|nr:MAG: hypothetical protein DMG34_12775 [Acidobacteriota bacterium]